VKIVPKTEFEVKFLGLPNSEGRMGSGPDGRLGKQAIQRIPSISILSKYL